MQNWKNIKKNEELKQQYINNLEQKILQKEMAIKKINITEDSAIEKVKGLDDIPKDK